MSKRRLKGALYSAHKLFSSDSGLAIKTRVNYQQMASLMLRELYDMNIQLPHIEKMVKPKYISKLISKWEENKLSSRTIKNRLSVLRYLSKSFDKVDILPKVNSMLTHMTPQNNKNRAIHELDLTKISDRYVKHSLELQRLFGLRREESIKFIPSYADKGDHIQLKGSWTKGGIARIIPITSQEQRDFLDELNKTVAKGSALIPTQNSYKQQENRYVHETRSADFKNLHGLRHGYAQRRYKALTNKLTNGNGWECPKNGGKSQRSLSESERNIDRQARLIISNELGHSRENITKKYLG